MMTGPLASSHTVNSHIFRFRTIVRCLIVILGSNVSPLRSAGGCCVLAEGAPDFRIMQATGAAALSGRNIRGLDRSNSATNPLSSFSVGRLQVVQLRGTRPEASSFSLTSRFLALRKTKYLRGVAGGILARTSGPSLLGGQRRRGGQKEVTLSIPRARLENKEVREPDDRACELSTAKKLIMRPCLTNRISVSSPVTPSKSNLPEKTKLAPWVVTDSGGDAEDAFLRAALVADNPYPLVRWPWLVDKVKQLASLLPSFEILPFTLSKFETVSGLFGNSRGAYTTAQSKITIRGDRTSKAKSILPLQQDVQRLHRFPGARASISTARAQRKFSVVPSPNRFRRQQQRTRPSSTQDAKTMQQRRLTPAQPLTVRGRIVSTISLPPMRTRKLLIVLPGNDFRRPLHIGDVRSDHPFLPMRQQQRQVLKFSPVRRRWQVSGGSKNGNLRNRALLADISPPGMWPDADDDDSGVYTQLEFDDNSGS